MGDMRQTSIKVTPTVQAAAYATGDVMGGKMTFTALAPKGRTNTLSSIRITAKNAVAQPIDIIFFSANPAATTFTENGAVAIDDADLDKIIGVVNIPTAAWVVVATGRAVAFVNCKLPLLGVPSTGIIYACMVARGAITPGTTTDFIVELVSGGAV